MESGPVVTASQMEDLTPNERHQLVNDRVVTDLSQLPEGFRERVLAKGRRLLAERNVALPDQP